MVDQVITNKILRYIRCTTGSETFALDMDAVYSIQRSDNLHLDPISPDGIGWFPVREAQVPVYSLSKCLGDKKSVHSTVGRVILMSPSSEHTGFWGLAVDQVSQVYNTGFQALSPLPESLSIGSQRYFHAVLRAADELYLMIDPAGIHPGNLEPVKKKYFEKSVATFTAADTTVRTEDVGRGQTRQKQLIIFYLPGETEHLQFGLSITQVLEILTPLPVIALPGAPDYILGLVNWRDRPIPLVDLPARLGLQSLAEPASPRLMIVRDKLNRQTRVMGFYVHPNIHMLRLPVKERPTSSQVTIPQELIKGKVEIDGRLTVIPKISTILAK